MPTYPFTIGGVTYDIDSERPLSPQEVTQLGIQQYQADKKGEQDHLSLSSALPTEAEAAQEPTGSMWEGMEDAGKGIAYGLLNTVAHPIDTAGNLIKAQGAEFSKARDEATSPNGSMLASAGHLAAGMLPVLGPAAANVGEDLGQGERDPRALGRAMVNGSLLLGPGAGKAGVENAGALSEFGTKLATEYPGVVPGAIAAAHGFSKGGILQGLGEGFAAAKTADLAKATADFLKAKKGEAEGATPKPVQPRGGVKKGGVEAPPDRFQKTPEQVAKDAEDDAFAEKMERDKGIDPNSPPKSNGTYGTQLKPLPSHATQSQALGMEPDFLKQDVVRYPRSNVLRSDESVLGLARELDPNVKSLKAYPRPVGSDTTSKALRQRANIAEGNPKRAAAPKKVGKK